MTKEELRAYGVTVMGQIGFKNIEFLKVDHLKGFLGTAAQTNNPYIEMVITKENPQEITLIRVELDMGRDTYDIYGSKGELKNLNKEEAVKMTDIYGDSFHIALAELTGLELPQIVAWN